MFILALLGSAFASDLMFVGNSYTYYNDLPSLVANLLEEGVGGSVQTTALTSGGLKFVDHLSRSQNNTNWINGFSVYHDFVLFQEQSQIPGFPQSESMWIASQDAFVALDDLAEAQGSASMLLMTWGRRDGDSTNSWLYPDFATMQELLKEGYLTYADTATTSERPIWVAPMGLGFANLKIHHPALFEQLYTGDGSHPSYAGSYLAACVIYAALTGYSPVGLVAGAPTDAQVFQEMAELSVIDEPFGDIPYPWAWTELPSDGIVFAENMRPHLQYNEISSIDIVVDNARLWIASGEINGALSVASNSEALLTGGTITGDIQGDLQMTGGYLRVANIDGSLTQSNAGTIVLRDLQVTEAAMLSNVTFQLPEDQDYAILQAGTLVVSQPVIDESLFWSVDESLGRLEIWRNDPNAEPEPEPEPSSEPSDESSDEPSSEPSSDSPSESDEPSADPTEPSSDNLDQEDSGADKSGCQHVSGGAVTPWLLLSLLGLRRRKVLAP